MKRLNSRHTYNQRYSRFCYKNRWFITSMGGDVSMKSFCEEDVCNIPMFQANDYLYLARLRYQADIILEMEGRYAQEE